MRKRWLGLLLGAFVLATVPGCRTAAAIGVAAAAVALDWRYGSHECHCDRHSVAPPMHRCR
jgi:hypothetical protein